MIRSIIVDDEIKNIEILSMMLQEYCEDVVVVSTAKSVVEAKLEIEKYRPNLVFLDVEMPPFTAFDLLKSIEKIDFEVVFVTAFNYYAIEAIKFSALYYVLKPIKIDDLKDAIERAKAKIGSLAKNNGQFEVLFQNPTELQKIVVNSTHETYIIELKDIIYIKADNSYSIIYKNNNEKIVSSKPIIEYEKLLHSRGFYRTHKSFLVNLKHIEKLSKGENLSIKMTSGDSVPIAIRRRDEFLKVMKK